MQAECIHPARYWHAVTRPDGVPAIMCTCCPRECVLAEGQRGFCFSRRNTGGQLDLTSYGRAIGLCADPIEKKPLNHFLPGTGVLSFGTAGCNLGCRFCQNWNMSKARDTDAEAQYLTPERLAARAGEVGCASVAFTYNDPTIFPEYAIDCAIACHERGIRTMAVSAGFIGAEARRDLYRHMDAANIDLKGFTERFYRTICLGGELERVLETLRYIRHETQTWLEITTLLIPGENDGDAEVAAEAEWLVEHLGPDVPLHFTAFHPDWKMLRHPATPHATLLRARALALRAGLRFVYVGNVHDARAGSMWCPTCASLLIERDWYEMGAYNLRANRCRFCDAAIPGVFAPGGPGHFGARRFAVTR